MTAIGNNMFDYALREESLLRRGMVEVFAKSSPILDDVHVIDVGNAEEYKYLVEAGLGAAQWRAMGETITADSGITNPAKESLSILSTMVRVDRQRAGNSDYVASRVMSRIKALGAMLTKDFFDGDTATNPKQMKGLNARIGGGQLTYALDESGATTDGGYFNKSLAAIRAMIRSVRGPVGEKVLYMSGLAHDLLSEAVASESQQNYLVVQGDGGVSSLIPSFERVKIVEIEDDHLGNEILAQDETRGNSNVTTSIYCVWKGTSDGEGLNLLAHRGNQGLFDMDPFVQNNTQREAPVEGKFGMALHHPRSAARMAGFLGTNYSA